MSTLGICLVLLCLLFILIGNRINLEVILYQLFEEYWQFVWLSGKVRHAHHWQYLPDEFALSRVIIYKDKGVKTNVQFPSKFLNVRRLISPIDSIRGEMLFLQYHERILLPCVKHILFVIL